MNKLKKHLSKSILVSFILAAAVLTGSCQNWMSSDDFMKKIETEVHDANASPVSVYVRYANSKMGTTEPQGNTTMKVDVETQLTAVTSDDYGFVKWAAFSTSDFPTSKQHSTLFYESKTAWEQNFKSKELPASVVSFTNPKSPVTNVKINKLRNDIFIIPVVAKRPDVAASVPSNGRSDVVRNSSIRILFTKPINERTLADEDGNSNIVVTSGSAILTDNSDEMDRKDITDWFDITLSSSGKMLTLALKTGKELDSNSEIRVNIYEEVCDKDGYSMNGKYTFSFVTGTKRDSLSPSIDFIYAGIGQDCKSYLEYGYNKTGNKTTIAANISSSLSHYTYGEDNYVLGQRVKDKLNVFIKAYDWIGSGLGVTPSSDTQSENGVAVIQARAALIVNSEGITISSPVYVNLPDMPYAAGTKDKSCEINEAFEVVTGSGGNMNTSGTLFTYDLSAEFGNNKIKLGDGIIKIDLWAVDTVGNSSWNESSTYTDIYNNGYRSILVVKDSTAPSTSYNRSKIAYTQLPADGYINFDTYKNITISVDQSNPIIDLGIDSLKSASNKIEWIILATPDTTWADPDKLSVDDARWKPVNQGYNLKDFTPPASDGPLYLTYALKDDLGNISAAEKLREDVINYDNTKPELDDISWEAEGGAETGLATGNVITNQTLVIPVRDITSGIKKIEITPVKVNGNGNGNDSEYDKPFENQNSKIYIDGSLVSNWNSEDKVLTLSNPKITSENSTATIKIKNLTVIENSNTTQAEGRYNIKVKVYDSAGNISNEKTVSLSNDSTAPLVQSIIVKDIIKAKEAGSSSFEYWADYSKLDKSKSSPKTNIYVSFIENNSGAKVFDFSDSSIKITNDTKLYIVNSALEPVGQPINCSKNINAKTIEINNSADAIVSSGNETVTVMFTDIMLQNSGVSNTVKLKISDRATNTSVDKTKFALKDNPNDEYDGFKFDSTAPSFATQTQSVTPYKLVDRADDKNITTEGYTNENLINAVIIPQTASSSIAGVYGVIIDGAQIVQTGDDSDKTKVSYGNTTIAHEISDGKILFKNADGSYMTFNSQTPITIKNLMVSSVEGNKTVKVKLINLSQNQSDEKSYTIKLDTTAPVWNGKGLYSAVDNRQTNPVLPEKVYPHPASNEKNYGISFGETYEGKDILYFYRRGTEEVEPGVTQDVSFIRVEPDVSDNNFSGVRWTQGTSYSDCEYCYGRFSGEFTAFAYDKAGNKTSDIKFNFITDSSFASADDIADIDNYMTINAPANDKFARVFRSEYCNDRVYPAADGIHYDHIKDTQVEETGLYSLMAYDYLIKQTSSPYTIKIKLGSGLTTADTLIGGTSPSTDVSPYSKTNATTASAPIDAYSVSHWYSQFRAPGFDTNENIPHTPDTLPAKMSWHTYEKSSQRNTDTDISSYVDSEGDIVIEIPNTRDTPPLTLILKDGCGNTTYRLIRPAAFTANETTVNNLTVGWIIDSQFGEGSYTGNLGYACTGNTNLLSEKSDVTFYRTEGTDKTQLHISHLSDMGRFATPDYTGAVGNENAYTMKSRIIVWNGTNAPVQKDFYEGSDSTLTAEKASAWYYYKQSVPVGNLSTAIELVNNFPEYNSSSLYELWVIIEDAVGHADIRQIKRGITGTMTKWFYDATPPSAHVTTPVNVNSISGKNYYSSASSVSYNIEDSGSGIKTGSYPGFNSVQHSSSVSNYSIGGISPQSGGRLKIPGAEDWAGNVAGEIELEYNNVKVWELLTNPVASTSTVVKDINNIEAGQTGSAVEVNTTSSSNVVTHTITSKRKNKSISVQLKTTSQDSMLLGWIISNTEITNPSSFYSLSTVDRSAQMTDSTKPVKPLANNTYVFSKTDENAWSGVSKKYFYAVNNSGLISQAPIIVQFAAYDIPSIEGNITYTDVGSYQTENYIKADSKISFKPLNNPTTCKIFYGIGANDCQTYDLTSITPVEGVYTLNLATGNLKNENLIKAKALSLVLYTSKEESEPVALKGNVNNNSWTYDVTAPDLALEDKPVFDKGNSEHEVTDIVDGVYCITRDNTIIKFKYTHTDIIKLEVTTDQVNYTDITSSLSGKKYQFTSPTVLKTYYLRATDKAGNTKVTSGVSLVKDTEGPGGTIGISSYKLNDTVVTTGYITNGDTISYSPGKVNKIVIEETVQITDAGIGLASPYLYYKIDNTETAVTSNTIPLPASGTKTCEIIAKDKKGNASTLKTFTFKAVTAGPEVSDHKKVPYSGLRYVPVYPGTYNSGDETNWIHGVYNNNNGYSMTANSTSPITEGELTIYKYDDQCRPGNTKETVSGYTTNSIILDSVTFTIPLKTSLMPSTDIQYAVTYLSWDDNPEVTITQPAAWTNGVISNGKITVTVNKSDIAGKHYFIFAWFKDALDNISVYSLSNPKDANTWNETWWTSSSGGNGGNGGGSPGANVLSEGLTLLQGLVSQNRGAPMLPVTAVPKFETPGLQKVQNTVVPKVEKQIEPKVAKASVSKVTKPSASKVKKESAPKVEKIELPKVKEISETIKEQGTEKLVEKAVEKITEIEESVQTVETIEPVQAAVKVQVESVPVAAPEHSAASIMLVILAVCLAAAGIWVGCKKRRILV